ncbi:MAG TPA: SDR family oxidoreductase, partial [Candidatus Polarisedimenticolia bacterium]|nr:SDR family oxidoreductase [Candidatus Polarisedimenticolia bacterium]
DVLVNNAGASGQNPIDASGPEADQKWLDLIATNLTGLYYMTRACLPHIPDGGRVINIASVLGKFGVPGYTAYCASKHGVIGFTRALAGELAPRGITVNAICPGWVDTAMAETGVRESATRLGVTTVEFKQAANQRVPLGRFLRPDEVAPLALYLASPAAAAMTGQAVNIEGGATTW